MQAREQRVAEREVELQALRDEAADAEPDDDARAEERRDIQAAVDSLQRKRARRRLSPAAQQADAAAAARRQVLRELRDEKEALQRAIIAAEEREEQQAENAADLPAPKAALAEAKQRRAREQANVDALRLELARRKRKMRHMVDVQLLTARDTNPPTLREEAVLLHLLYEREGEMGVNELKQEASAVLQAHGKPSGNGVVIRALYSLVANGVVQIDRSFGNGLVTSLLV
ncbi:unnamed protein product [Phytophthora lilii]|uniref:Unnamed protein product n=1 Tax=Phytophthora lilii TaxID=2077276 RepID=A0A9W6WQV9_9STRA|nr:unnamed protein product [Phytophthora lilii]